MKVLFFTILIISSHIVTAQGIVEGQMLKKMDLAVDLMEQGKYKQADETFLYVLQNMTSLPSDLAFYFGKNSFHLDKYKQSINWLNKYIQLKGTQGRFYDEAVEYLQMAEDGYLTIARNNKEKLKADLKGGEYDCGGLSKMICPVCKGQGVIIKRGPFERNYQTCPYSNGEAYLTCEEYNLFMSGELNPKKQ